MLHVQSTPNSTAWRGERLATEFNQQSLPPSYNPVKAKTEAHRLSSGHPQRRKAGTSLKKQTTTNKKKNKKTKNKNKKTKKQNHHKKEDFLMFVHASYANRNESQATSNKKERQATRKRVKQQERASSNKKEHQAADNNPSVSRLLPVYTGSLTIFTVSDHGNCYLPVAQNFFNLSGGCWISSE